MKLNSLFYRIIVLSLLNALMLTSTSYAQIPSKCLEIESILVDACVPGSGCSSASAPNCNCEGKNEMVRFQVGPSAINLGDIFIDWPNNSFQGIETPNVTTAGLVNSLNQTILGCGWLVEPVAGQIPAGSKVLLITSTEMCSGANSFENLNDTMVTIFQVAGNFQGHFANYNTNPGYRELVIGLNSTMCYDTVGYERSLLVNQLGALGGATSLKDGSRPDFDWAGNVTYSNDGCQAPVIVHTVEAGNNQTACADSVINLSGTTSNALASHIWLGGNGNFADSSNAQTQYTVSALDGNLLELYFGSINACNDTIFDTLQVTINAVLSPSLTTTANPICTGQNSTISVNGGSGMYLWDDGSTGASLIVNSGGTYEVEVIGACNSVNLDVEIIEISSPTISIANVGSLSLCPGETVDLESTYSGTSVVWSTGETTDDIVVSTAGTYTATTMSSCGNVISNSIVITAITNPTISISNLGSLNLCPGETTTLQSSYNGASIEWSTGETSDDIVVSVAGTYSATTISSCGNQVSNTLVITEMTSPTIQINAVGSTVLCPGETLILESTYSGNSVEWSTGETNDDILVNVAGTYSAVTVSSCGNITSNALVIVEDPCEPEIADTLIQIPNIFTPNGDNENENFHLLEIQDLTDARGFIVNRWGQKMFNWKSPTDSWDGTTLNGKDAPSGTYYLIIEYIYRTGKTDKAKEAFILQR